MSKPSKLKTLSKMLTTNTGSHTDITIHSKLTVNQPGDSLEQEADKISNSVSGLEATKDSDDAGKRSGGNQQLPEEERALFESRLGATRTMD